MIPKGLLLVSVALTTISFVLAEEIKFEPCSLKSQSICTISNVYIDPCAEAAKNEPCKLKRGNKAGISFQFNPTWEVGTEALKSRAYWVSVLDLPFLGMDTDACKMTTCPIKKGEINQYNYTLDISPTFLAQKYNVKFKLWEDQVQGHECCLIIKMRLV